MMQNKNNDAFFHLFGDSSYTIYMQMEISWQCVSSLKQNIYYYNSLIFHSLQNYIVLFFLHFFVIKQKNIHILSILISVEMNRISKSRTLYFQERYLKKIWIKTLYLHLITIYFLFHSCHFEGIWYSLLHPRISLFLGISRFLKKYYLCIHNKNN